METKDLFPTLFGIDNNFNLAGEMLPIAKAYLQYAEEVNLRINKLKSDSKDYKPQTLKDRWGYNTTYNSSYKRGYRELQSLEQIKPVREYILQLSEDFLQKYGYDKKTCSRLYISNLFVSEIFPGEQHPSHRHPNSIVSGVFYLQVPQGSSPIIIEDPRPHFSFFGPDNFISQETIYNTPQVVLYPKVGDIYLWNSWLPHTVPVSRSSYDGGRVTMVFNVNIG